MKKSLQWFADKVFWSLFLAPAASEWLKDAEWASWLSGIVACVNDFVVGLLGEAAFPWVSGILLGITLGVALHKIKVWLGAMLSKTEKQFEKLEELATDVLLYLPNYSGLSGLQNEPDVALIARTERLFAELKKLGVAVPDLAQCNSGNAIKTLDAYVTYIRPFLADRDANDLRQRAKQWLEFQKS